MSKIDMVYLLLAICVDKRTPSIVIVSPASSTLPRTALVTFAYIVSRDVNILG